METTTESDEIFVQKIKAYGYHGATEKENREGQWFFVDLKMSLPLAAAAATDDLATTVDYAAAAALAKDCVEERPPFALIERLAEVIASKILEAFPQIQKIEVAVHKPFAPLGVECEDVGVRIVRSRR